LRPAYPKSIPTFLPISIIDLFRGALSAAIMPGPSIFAFLYLDPDCAALQNEEIETDEFGQY
jgi:hypothetical protein